MKNIHRINGLIYITSDVEVLDGEYGACLNLIREGLSANLAIFKMDKDQRRAMEKLGGRKKAEVVKLILTNDPALISDGIQAIEPEAVKWLNENPSCEWVGVRKRFSDFTVEPFVGYELKLPDAEWLSPMQKFKRKTDSTHQTIEEAIEEKINIIHDSVRCPEFDLGFKTGAIAVVLSQAARDYWYNIFKSE